MADMQDDVDMSTLADKRDTSMMDWEPTQTYSPATRCKRSLDDLYEGSAVENSPSKRVRNVRRALRPLPKRAAISMVQLINNAIRHGPRSTAHFVRSIPYTLSTVRSGVPRVGARIYNRLFRRLPAVSQVETPPMPGTFPATPRHPHVQTPAKVRTTQDDNTSSASSTYTNNEKHPSRPHVTFPAAHSNIENESENTTSLSSTSDNTNTISTQSTQNDDATNALSQVPEPHTQSNVSPTAANAPSTNLQNEEEHPAATTSPSPYKNIEDMPTPDPGPGYYAWAAPSTQPRRLRVARDSPLEGQEHFERQAGATWELGLRRLRGNDAIFEVPDPSPTRTYSVHNARAQARRERYQRPNSTRVSNAHLTVEERARTRPARPVLEERNLNVASANVSDSPTSPLKDFSSKARMYRAQHRGVSSEQHKRRAAERKQAAVADRIARVESGFAQRRKESAESRTKRYEKAEAAEKTKVQAIAEAEAKTRAEAEAAEKAKAQAKAEAEAAEKVKAEARAVAEAKAKAAVEAAEAAEKEAIAAAGVKAKTEAEAKARAAQEAAALYMQEARMFFKAAPGLHDVDFEEDIDDSIFVQTVKNSRKNLDMCIEYNGEREDRDRLREEDPDESMLDITPPPKLQFQLGSAWFRGQRFDEGLDEYPQRDDLHPFGHTFPSKVRRFDNTLPVTDISNKTCWADSPLLRHLRPDDAGVAASPATTDASPIRLRNHPADSPMMKPSSHPSRLDQIRADACVAASPATTDALPISGPQDSGSETPSKDTESALGGGPATPARQTDTAASEEAGPMENLTTQIGNFFFTPSDPSRGRAQAVETSRERARREAERKAAIKADKERNNLEEKRRREEAERKTRANIIVELTPEMEKSVDVALSASSMSKECGQVTRKDLGTLLPQTSREGIGWLNDEVVNKYLEDVVDRAREKAGNPRIGKKEHVTVKYKAMSSFMYTQYNQNRAKGLEQFRTWSRRAWLNDDGLFGCEKVLIPINANSHWTLLVVTPPSRTITYYDSLGGAGSNYTQFALDWVKMVMGDHFVAEDWKIVASRSSRQMNGLDCGVFVCMNGLAVCRGVDPTDAFDDRSVRDARRQIAATLVGGGFNGVLQW